MATRFELRSDNDGSFSIVDLFTGLNARYAGRELTRIPAIMAHDGLGILNALDEAKRAVWELPTADANTKRY
jgi:hypothetical protein